MRMTENGREITPQEIFKRYGRRSGVGAASLQKRAQEGETFSPAEHLASRITDGRDIALNRIAKKLRRGPSTPASLNKRSSNRDSDIPAQHGPADRAVRSFAEEATDALRKIHAKGSRPLSPTFLDAPAEVAASEDATVLAIHKAQGSARSLHPYGTRPVDVDAITKLLKRGRMRKATFPPQSRNGIWDDARADDGATRNYAGNGDTGPVRPSLITRTPPRDMSSSSYIPAAANSYGVAGKSNYHAATDAIKRDLMRPKRMDGGS